ncbi:bifunctional 4-hydroxy-2-oxoglutarate aldolase/2-dehydro-3-deoxy-phosphogluconate aldolase [Arenicella xantha]|uniref:2-dehydro-3-deoxy-phosphogluconate aldolase n=1 Tax=Arenicella xantha TaxID=644221 RepID=A0A395JKN1_9GAMM|nr:bifunctional 4-hydroxy-2-oxoglutarate aldolase/2-dehydro-3-deoxy-phosphogluconate aldolase [Arenicella xantha]RBP49751.1 2-keto-3-deoxy-phosphogluconate aldolase [Arenicella xantha]
MKNQPSVGDLLGDQKVVPVVVIDNEEQAHGLAQALLDGGVKVIEITLRNAYGVHAIELIKKTYPEMIVLAGTVNSAAQLVAVVQAGVDGIISPGITAKLAEAAREQGIPYLPGVATASEVLLAIEYGLRECKLFPATVVGGIGALKALGGPFPAMRFCPTGGVSESNYQDFLALPNVMCVGGSWIAPTSLVNAGKWSEITALCKAVTA